MCVGSVGKELPTDAAFMSEERDNSQTSRRLCVLCKRLEPITQSHGVTSRKKGVVETKDLYTKTRYDEGDVWRIGDDQLVD
jgi:hypothetical protein